LKAATPLPIRDLSDDLDTRDQSLTLIAYGGPWKAAVLAYRAKRYDLAFAVCERWERYREQVSPTADASYHTIRAACYLAQGEFAKARPLAAEMLEMRKYRRHLGDNVEALISAIERRDRSFVYETDEGPFELLLKYE